MSAFWRDGHHVRTHYIDDEGWPTCVAPLARHLKEKSSRVQYTSSPQETGIPLIDDLAAPGASKCLAGNHIDTDLSNLFDITMDTAFSLSRIKKIDNLQFGQVLILSFISQITSTLWPSLSVLENQNIVLPRHPLYGFNPFQVYTSPFLLAPLLVLYKPKNLAIVHVEAENSSVCEAKDHVPYAVHSQDHKESRSVRKQSAVEIDDNDDGSPGSANMGLNISCVDPVSDSGSVPTTSPNYLLNYHVIPSTTGTHPSGLVLLWGLRRQFWE